jgi:NADH-quinone oxidoreductase subunit N
LLALASLVSRPLRVRVATVATLAIAGTAVGISIWQWFDVQDHGPHTYVANAVVMDGFSVLITMLVASAMVVTALVADGYLRREDISGAEFHVLALVSASGAMLMGMANDLIIVFLGLEILSIALYVLTAFNHRRAASGEAALKYFILGGFSSAIFIYGIALTYGATGSTNLTQIADFLSKNAVLTNGLLLAGLALMLVGFAFKVAAVPFHMWTPDVYQGAPSPVTGFMSAVAKAGAFAAMLRVLFTSFGVVSTDWKPIIYGLAVLSLVLGSVLALRQRDVKRMLAYSSINHAGFILLGVEAATTRGVSASLYYLFAYTFMTIGSFAVVTAAAAGAVLCRPVVGSGRGPVHHRFVGQAAGRPGHHLGRCGTAGRHRHGDRRHRGLLLPPGGRAHVRPQGGRRRATAGGENGAGGGPVELGVTGRGVGHHLHAERGDPSG